MTWVLCTVIVTLGIVLCVGLVADAWAKKRNP